MLTILITFRKIYFLTNLLNFCRGYITFFRKMANKFTFHFLLLLKAFLLLTILQGKHMKFEHFFYQISLLQFNKKINIQRERKNVQLAVNKITWKNRTFATGTLFDKFDKKLHESILKVKLLL